MLVFYALTLMSNNFLHRKAEMSNDVSEVEAVFIVIISLMMLVQAWQKIVAFPMHSKLSIDESLCISNSQGEIKIMDRYGILVVVAQVIVIIFVVFILVIILVFIFVLYSRHRKA